MPNLETKTLSLKVDKQTVESRGFALFRDTRSNSYMRTLYYLVFNTIRSNSSIGGKGLSEDRLKQALTKKHRVTRQDIDSAISALASPDIYNCLHVWTVGDSNKRLYRLRADTEIYSSWEEKLLTEMPELKGFQFQLH